MRLTRVERMLLVVLNAFLAMSAIAGGIGLLGGGIQFPLEWLRGSPFSSYLIPGLALLAIVGGSASIATALLLLRHPRAALASGAAGTIMMIFEIVEVLVVGSQPGLMRNLQILYFTLGLVIVGLAVQWWASAYVARQRRPHATTP